MNTLYFAESHMGKTEGDYLFIDGPFVGSIFCTSTANQYLLDFWVSGSFPKSSPSLVLRTRTAIRCDKGRLESKLQSIWNRSLKDLAKASSKTGGIHASTEEFKQLPLDSQVNLIQGHLLAHDRSNGFNNIGYSKVAKTASMYLFLQTMGTKQLQKALASHEDPEMLGEVKTTAINQRLALAKQAGYIK